MDTPDDLMSTASRMWLWSVAILVGFPIFGASGAIVFGVLTWLLLARLFRAAPEVRGTAAGAVP